MGSCFKGQGYTVGGPEKICRTTYEQEGAVGVVNDEGTFEGEINYGVSPPTNKKKKDRRECPCRVSMYEVLNFKSFRSPPKPQPEYATWVPPPRVQ